MVPYVLGQEEHTTQDVQKVRPARPQPMATPQAYPPGYVEDVAEVRTPLADFFSILRIPSPD